MVIQSVDGVALNLTFMDFKYINTPPEDQTYFISFLLWPKALAAFLGQAAGTLFLNEAADWHTVLFGMQILPVHMSSACPNRCFFSHALYGSVFVLNELTSGPNWNQVDELNGGLK